MRQPNTKSTISVTLIAAFLMHVLLPFFAVSHVTLANASADESPALNELSSLFGEKILICTVNGYEWVTWEELQKGEQQPQPHPQYECALCHIAAKDLKHILAVAPLDVGHALPISKAPAIVSYAAPVANNPFKANHPSRAPPHSLIS